MANLIELFEENVEHNQYSHGFELIEIVKKEESIAGKITDIIFEDGVDAVLELKKGIELNKIDFDLEATDEENLYVCVFKLEKDITNSELCMGVYTKAEMVEYLKKYVQQKLKEEVFPTLDTFKELMKKKKSVSLELELFNFKNEQFPDNNNMSLSVSADSEFTAKFVYNYRNETYSTTITEKEEGEYEIDDLTEAYAVFSIFYPYDDWEEVIAPLKKWIEENQ